MTLYRQISGVLLILFLFIFGGILFISVNNTRAFLTDQLQSHAQDTATSLGLSLSSAIKNNDNATMLTMVQAIFDPGYYQSITINDLEGKPIVQRYAPGEIKGVPGWFVHLVPLPSPSGQALLMSGWTQKGTVTVVSFPGLAYYQLWETTKDLLVWFILIYLLAVVLSSVALYFLLKPLRTITKQAQAVCNREFPMSTQLPRTKELRVVATAMNNMIGKVKVMLDEQSALSENLRKQAYQDPLTELGNRRYFDMELSQLLSNKDEIRLGALFLLEVQGLKAFNDNYGYQAGDELLKRIAQVIKNTCQDLKENFIARLAGGTFGIIIPNLTPEETEQLANSLIYALEQMITTLPEAKERVLAHAGIAHFSEDLTAPQLLSVADQALRAAQVKGPFGFVLHEDATINPANVRKATEWKKFLERIINEDLVTVHYQPVMRFSDKQIMHYEALLRIPDRNNSLVPASIVIPIAERYGITHQLDKCVIKKVFKQAEADQSGVSYVMNLSQNTIINTETMEWLLQELKERNLPNKFIFELTEYTVVTNLPLVRELIQRFNKVGAHMSIDHFGRGFTSFGYLRSLPVVHIKIDGGFIRDIANQDTQFLLTFITKIAHTLDIQVIAESVETEQQWELLQGFQIDGVQGIFLAPPAHQD